MGMKQATRGVREVNRANDGLEMVAPDDGLNEAHPVVLVDPEVDRAIDVLTRAEQLVHSLSSQVFVAKLVADPVDLEDWIATSACVERLAARVRHITDLACAGAL